MLCTHAVTMKYQVNSSLQSSYLSPMFEVAVLVTNKFKNVQYQEHKRIKVFKRDSNKHL
jgi:hypothetical protein